MAEIVPTIDTVAVTVHGHDLGDGEISPVTSYFDWWDCPRAGVALYGGRPHYFLVEFSDALDEYEESYTLWPVPKQAIALEKDWWERWCEWRAAYDRGESPQSIDRDSGFEQLTQMLREFRKAPASSLRLQAEWLLDRDRSFARRVPRHGVRWRLLS